MLTLGDSDYIRSKPVILHELVHQWFGDLVTPSDWSDVWLNEGITTYVEARYAAESENNAGRPRIKDWKSFDSALRREAGPPGDYDPEEFGSGNVDFSAGLMWSEIHDLVGEEAFWEMLRAWTQEHARRQRHPRRLVRADRGTRRDRPRNRAGRLLRRLDHGGIRTSPVSR